MPSGSSWANSWLDTWGTSWGGVPAATINYQGDGLSRKKRKKKRRQFDDLLAEIERSLHAVLAGPTTEPLVVAELPILAEGFEAALDRLLLLAEDRKDLSLRIDRLRLQVQLYEVQQRLSQDEEEEMVMLL